MNNQDKMNNRKLKTGCEPACLSLAEEQYDSLDRTIGFLFEYGIDKEHESKKRHYKKAVKRWIFLHVKNKMPVWA